jgi:hypothetical protein
MNNLTLFLICLALPWATLGLLGFVYLWSTVTPGEDRPRIGCCTRNPWLAAVPMALGALAARNAQRRHQLAALGAHRMVLPAHRIPLRDPDARTNR